MGLSLISVLSIQENETMVVHYFDKGSEKYGFSITHNEEKYCRPIVSSDAIYNSEKEALAGGNKVVDEIKELDLRPQKEGLVEMMGGEETAKAVESVVRASKTNE